MKKNTRYVNVSVNPSRVFSLHKASSSSKKRIVHAVIFYFFFITTRNNYCIVIKQLALVNNHSRDLDFIATILSFPSQYFLPHCFTFCTKYILDNVNKRKVDFWNLNKFPRTCFTFRHASLSGLNSNSQIVLVVFCSLKFVQKISRNSHSVYLDVFPLNLLMIW